MQVFIIEAYGGPDRTDGVIRHFTVQAETFEEAVAMLRQSEHGKGFEHFELKDSAEAGAGERGIVDESDELGISSR